MSPILQNAHLNSYQSVATLTIKLTPLCQALSSTLIRQ
jgi:hypothetical protein